MRTPLLCCGLFLTLAFGLAARLQPWQAARSGDRQENALSLLLGDSRRMFANQLYAKADAYFHNGYYPTIFDNAKPEEKSHVETAATAAADPHQGHDHAEPAGEECHEDHDHSGHANHAGEDAADGFLGQPLDWIDRLSRNFYPSRHLHADSEAGYKEILPWLQLSAQLEPHKIEIYTVAAFTLREKMNQPEAAESFLREGWRRNPDSSELLFELGRIYAENRHDAVRARNLWELAVQKWKLRNDPLAEEAKDYFALRQILAFLGKLEFENGNYAVALAHFERLKTISPPGSGWDQWIRDTREKMGQPVDSFPPFVPLF